MSLGVNQFQVFNSVVIPNAVLVVNMLPLLKWSFEMLHHNKAML